MNELVSVVIPVYNAGKVIERCVESLINGYYLEIEIILVDDCSQDDSFEICKKLAEKYKNITVVHNDCNQGVSYSRNIGLQHVTGKYLCFVDSDDWVEKSYIQKLYSSLKTTDSNFAICGFINHDEMHNQLTTYFKCTDKDFYEQVKIENIMLKLFDGRLLQQLWNKIFLTKIIKDNSLMFDENLNIGEDFRFVLDYLSTLETIKTVLIPECLYHYIRDSENSLMFKLSIDTISESIKNINKMFSLLSLDKDDKSDLLLQVRKSKAMEYAYIVMHDKQLKKMEKIEKIRMIENISGYKLLCSSVMLFFKEKIFNILH